MVVINQTFPYPIKQMKLCLFMLIIKRQYPRVDNLKTFFSLSSEDRDHSAGSIWGGLLYMSIMIPPEEVITVPLPGWSRRASHKFPLLSQSPLKALPP